MQHTNLSPAEVQNLKVEIADFINELSVIADGHLAAFQSLPIEHQHSADGLKIRNELFELINAQSELTMAIDNLNVIELLPMMAKSRRFSA